MDKAAAARLLTAAHAPDTLVGLEEEVAVAAIAHGKKLSQRRGLFRVNIMGYHGQGIGRMMTARLKRVGNRYQRGSDTLLIYST